MLFILSNGELLDEDNINDILSHYTDANVTSCFVSRRSDSQLFWIVLKNKIRATSRASFLKRVLTIAIYKKKHQTKCFIQLNEVLKMFKFSMENPKGYYNLCRHMRHFTFSNSNFLWKTQRNTTIFVGTWDISHCVQAPGSKIHIPYKVIERKI